MGDAVNKDGRRAFLFGLSQSMCGHEIKFVRENFVSI